MLGARDVLGLLLIVSLITVSRASSSEINDEIYDRAEGQPSQYDNHVHYLMESKRSLSAIKRLVDELESNIGKRMCEIGGGMSAACNNKDLVDAMIQHRYLVSPYAPGRRRRRSTSLMLDQN